MEQRLERLLVFIVRRVDVGHDALLEERLHAQQSAAGRDWGEYAEALPTNTLVQGTVCQKNGLECIGCEEIRVVSIERILRHDENLEIKSSGQRNGRLLLLPLFVLALRIGRESESHLQVGDHRFD